SSCVIKLYVYILLLLSWVLLSQPEQRLYVSTNGNARIRCSSHEDLDTGSRIFWYKKTSLSGETPRLVTRCASEENPQKYKCESAARRVTLEILNVTGADSGIYYCAMIYVRNLRIANGTALIVQGKEGKVTYCLLTQQRTFQPGDGLQLLSALNTEDLMEVEKVLYVEIKS
uniref:Ig-like domain-containing protein n=1 Tax=Leptobrachium leishanense TaxID=445787 RepID=A0A8C5WJG2_9ANUR